MQEDKLATCQMCGDEMLYWQLQNHIAIHHHDLNKWTFWVGSDYHYVCTQCAHSIISANNLEQVDFYDYKGANDETDLEFYLWQPFKQSLEPFKCEPCWERNH